MPVGLLGGFAAPAQFERISRQVGFNLESEVAKDGRNAFLWCDEPNATIRQFDDAAVLVRGYAVLPDGDLACPPDDFAQFAYRRYKTVDSCDFGDCDGSFSVVVLDAQRTLLLAFRNIANNRFTYVANSDACSLVASNLATLTSCLPKRPSVNEEQLPSYFLFPPLLLFT